MTSNRAFASSDDFQPSRAVLPRRPLLRTSKSHILLILALMVLVPACYVMEGWKMDRQNRNEILSLDLEVASHFVSGKKTINKWGVLKRADTMVTCSGGAPGRESVDWSNSATCMANAILHTNCVPVCDASFSSCDGCTALQTDHDTQLAVAQARCTQRANYQCLLKTKNNGKGYDYVALSQCCLGSLPFGEEACLCQNQLSSAPTCYGFGNCMPGCLTSSLRTTCSGTISALPTAPVTCTNPLAASCSGPGAGTDLSCTSGNFLSNGICGTSCPSGTYGAAGVCTQCVSPALTCSSATVALSCASGSFLSAGTCVATCPPYYFGATATNTCNLCYNAHTLTCTDAGRQSGLTCDNGTYLDPVNGCQANTCYYKTPFTIVAGGYTFCKTSCPAYDYTTYQVGGAPNGYYQPTPPYNGVSDYCVPCPTGTYSSASVCKACTITGAAGCGSATSVYACSTGLTLNENTNTCISGTCPLKNTAGTAFMLPVMFQTGPGCIVGTSDGTATGSPTAGSILTGCGKITNASGVTYQYYAKVSSHYTNICVPIASCTKANQGTVDANGYGTCTGNVYLALAA